MGPFDEVIGGMRVSSSLYAHFRFGSPWGVRFATGAQARVVIVARGRAWLRWSGSKAPLLVASPSCLLVQPGVVFDLADEPKRDAIACETILPVIDGRLVEHGGDGDVTELVAGRLTFDPIAAEPLMTAMPPLVHVALDPSLATRLRTILEVVGVETQEAGLGSGLVIERLSDALFVQAMRAVFASGSASPPSWITGVTDGRVTKAIRAVHADLAKPWTVAQMARAAGTSRSTFAAAFTSAMGEAPLDYLTRWRVYRAKLLLSSSDASLVEIARRVGYDSDTALSRVFKRKVGVPPGAFRRAHGGSSEPEPEVR